MQSTTPHDLFGAELQIDDHAIPSFLRRSSDGRILAFATAHNAPGLRIFVSTNPDDPTSFGSATDLDSQLGGTQYTYTNPLELTGEVDSPIYLIFRDEISSVKHIYYSKSLDQGTTWATRTRLFANAGGGNDNAPYVKVVHTGPDRFDMFLTDGHPNLTATNSIYHCYYQGGSFRKTDGTALTLPITPATDLTKVYDGTTTRAWIHDAAVIGGVPVCVFATFPTAATDHRYHQRRLSGGSWVGAQVCTAGGPLYTDETYYSGGVAQDPNNIDQVFASREINGVHQIWRHTTADSGSTWSAGTQITQGPRSFRPYLIRNAAEPRLQFMYGNYHTFVAYDTDLKLIASDIAGVTLPTDPQYSDAKLIVNFGGPAGGVVVADFSAAARTPTFRGDAVLKALSTPFGVSAVRFDGSGDAVTFPNHADFQLGTSDFTIEAIIAQDDYTSGNDKTVFGLWRTDNSQRSIRLDITTAGILTLLGSSNGTSSTTIVTADISALANLVWAQLAVRRVGNVFTLWLNGTQIGTATTAFTFFAGTGLFNLGNFQTGATTWSPTASMLGYMGGFRLTRASRSIALLDAGFPIAA